jgi:3',5'-cyclic AMP phosphodiesterase CpdA
MTSLNWTTAPAIDMRPSRRGLATLIALIVVVVTVAPTARSSPTSWIAVVGDFGMGNAAEATVARMIAARQPLAVVTTGDNIYGSADYGRAVGSYYCRFIGRAPSTPACPASAMAAVNSFFPATGNHDYSDAGIEAFRSYFRALGGRTTYSVTRGDIEFLIVDSERALDSSASMTQQREWLRWRARTSRAPWQVVVLHHPPFSSSTVHGSSPQFQWPFDQWGVDLVLSGHDHSYERIQRGGLTYVVNGSGGADLYRLGTPLAGSVARNDSEHGALFLRSAGGRLTGVFVTAAGPPIDRFALAARTPLLDGG